MQPVVPEERDGSQGFPQPGIPAPVLQGERGPEALPGHLEHRAGGEHIVVRTGSTGTHHFQVVGPTGGGQGKQSAREAGTGAEVVLPRRTDSNVVISLI